MKVTNCLVKKIGYTLHNRQVFKKKIRRFFYARILKIKPKYQSAGRKGVKRMPYVEPEIVQKVKEIDLLTYLQNYEPYELVHYLNILL